MLVQPHLDTVMTRRRQRKIKSVSIKGVYQSETPCGSRKIVVSEKQRTFGNLVWELRAFNKIAWLIALRFTSVENNGRLTHSGDSYKVTTASFHLLFHFVWSSLFCRELNFVNCSRYAAALMFCKLVIFDINYSQSFILVIYYVHCLFRKKELLRY